MIHELSVAGADRVVGRLYGREHAEDIGDDLLLVEFGRYAIHVRWWPKYDPEGAYLVRLTEDGTKIDGLKTSNATEVKNYIEKEVTRRAARPSVAARILAATKGAVASSVSAVLGHSTPREQLERDAYEALRLAHAETARAIHRQRVELRQLHADMARRVTQFNAISATGSEAVVVPRHDSGGRHRFVFADSLTSVILQGASATADPPAVPPVIARRMRPSSIGAATRVEVQTEEVARA